MGSEAEGIGGDIADGGDVGLAFDDKRCDDAEGCNAHEEGEALARELGAFRHRKVCLGIFHRTGPGCMIRCVLFKFLAPLRSRNGRPKVTMSRSSRRDAIPSPIAVSMGSSFVFSAS